MSSPHRNAAPMNSQSSQNRPSSVVPTSEVFGFPIAVNQYKVLSEEQAALSSGQVQGYTSLVNPRTTRLHQLRATQEAAARGDSTTEDILNMFTPVENDAQKLLYSGQAVDSVTSELPSYSLHSLSVRNFELESGNFVDANNAMYIKNLKDVECTVGHCNKRISTAGSEWSAGRPGHTPTRRDVACVSQLEDSRAGQEWSAGRPGLRPFGARLPACTPSAPACIGPYGTAAQPIPHHTGPNTRTVSLPSKLPRQEGQDNINQLYTTNVASTSQTHAAEDRASPAMVALQPRRPPYYSGGLDEDVYTWTSIVDRWLGTVKGEPSRQLTFVVSLLRGAAYDWYHHYEMRTGCPGDWTTLRLAMLERFGTSIRVEKARAGLYQLKQDKMTVLEYTSAFEHFLAQIGDYDESYYLIHYIFGLRPEIMRLVYVQEPASLLAAKTLAEKLELTHQATAMKQRNSKKEKKTPKYAQHSGTQEMRSSRRIQSVRTTQKACQYRSRQMKNTQSHHQHKIGCISARKGAVEASCPERHGPAVVWRSFVKDLPQGDRTRRVRRQGSVVIVDLVALARVKEQRSADPTVAGMSMHPPSGRAHAPRVYLRNRLLRRDRERRTRASVRERQMVAQLLETLVSPSSGGTESCIRATTGILQGWQSIGLTKAITDKEAEKGRTAPEEPQTQLSVISTEYQPPVPRAEEDGILMIVPARIFGREIRALIDSGATRNFISPAGVTQCGLTVESHNTFLELGDGKKVLSRGRAVDVPVVTSGFEMKTDLTVCSLLHGVDLVLGMTWLKVADPLIRWSTGQLFIPDSPQSFQRIMGHWLDKQVKIGTVRVLSTNEDLESLKQPSNAASIEVLKNPGFWAIAQETQNSWRSSRAQGGAVAVQKFFELTHPGFGVLKVQKLNNNAALPKRSTAGAGGYDLCASQDCVIPAGGKGLVPTGLSISFPAGLYARIAPRSGLALKKFINVGAGVVDADYRGEVGVVLFNHGDQDFQVKMGDRIAQLILERIDTPPVEEVSGLGETIRGTGGFGSTGIESGNDTGNEANVQCKHERTGEECKEKEKNEKAVKENETLKGLGRFSGHRNRTEKKQKKTTEGSSRLSRERQLISVKQLKKLVKKKTPVFLAVVWGQEYRKVNAAVKTESIGLTEGRKRDLMRKTGPKKKFLSVEEREQQILEKVSPDVRGKLKEFVDEFKDVFPDTLPKGRPPKRDIVHEIRTEEGVKPPSRPPYRLGPAEQDEMEEQVKDLLAQGFIRPSASPYGAPILFVPKKDGRWRMCIDYRALNKQTIKDQFPLPRIDSLLERLGQATVFTKLDLTSGYHQIAMEETSV